MVRNLSRKKRKFNRQKHALGLADQNMLGVWDKKSLVLGPRSLDCVLDSNVRKLGSYAQM